MKNPDWRIAVKFFTRQGCHLCEDARELLREFEDEYALLIEEINILRAKQYYEQYKHTIPVLIIGEMQAIESIITRDEIQRQIDAILDKRNQ
ncbi:MAG: glutaredoxin family protein [bacterium]